MTTRSCGEQIPFLLRDYGVDIVFGMPGVHSLEFYRSLEEAGIRHIAVRHEQGAGFMADGYARACGKPGVAMLISGPGVTNASTPIGHAWADSVPILVLTAAIARENIGLNRGALHEITDQRAVTAPLVSLSALAHTAEQVPAYLASAFARFSSARPRPVHLSVPIDVLSEPLPEANALRSTPARPGPDPKVIEDAARLLGAASNPVIIAGGGAAKAGPYLKDLIERTGALFVTSIAGKGCVPESHPLSLGSTLQRLPTRRAIAEADCVLAIGTEIAEPDLYVTADMENADHIDPEMLKPRLVVKGRFIRIDIDPDVAVRDYDPDLAIVGDAALAARALAGALSDHTADLDAAAGRAAAIRDANDASMSDFERMHDTVLHALRAALPEDALIFADMTQIAYTGCITFPVEQPGCWHFSVGFGTLGVALPNAIGGQLACPGRATCVLVGDCGLQFTLQELATAMELELPIPIVLWDNDALGEIADFMRARQIPQIGVYPKNPDFRTLASAYDTGYTAPETLAEVTNAVREALSAKGPTLIHVRQSRFATDA